MWLTVSIDEDKTLALATLAELLTEQDLEATIFEELVSSLDEQLVEEYCGEKQARGNGENRYQRAGTSTRSATTTAPVNTPSISTTCTILRKKRRYFPNESRECCLNATNQ